MSNTDVIFQEAFTAHQGMNLCDAANGYQKVLSAEPEHPSALHLMGLIHLEQGNYEAAIPLVEKSIALAPGEVQWILNYGALLSKAGRPMDSIAAYHKVLSMSPGSEAAKLSLAELYFKQGNYEAALKYYYDVLSNKPPDMHVAENYCKTLEAMGRHDLAQNFRKLCSRQKMDCDGKTDIAKTPSQEQEHQTDAVGETQRKIETQVNRYHRPTMLLDSALEPCVIADALYHMGYREAAGRYVITSYVEFEKGVIPKSVPGDMLRRWKCPDFNTLLAKMWLTICSHSTYYATIEETERVLKSWIQSCPSDPEPFLKLGIGMAFGALKHGRPVPNEALDALRYAHKTMANERSKVALELAERAALPGLSLPYDNTRLSVYPDLMNLSTYVLLEKEDWFEDEIVLFRKMIRKDDQILDIGANIGAYSVSASRRTQQGGRVVSVEPCSETFAILQNNLAPFNHVTAIHGAVGKENGIGRLEPGNDSETHKVLMDKGPGETVRILSIDAIAKHHNIEGFDIIKIDVEGKGKPIIEGAERIIREGAPIIFYELKYENKPDIEMVEALEALGYDSYRFNKQGMTLSRFFKDDPDTMFLLNLVAAKPESMGRFDGIVEVI